MTYCATSSIQQEVPAFNKSILSVASLLDFTHETDSNDSESRNQRILVNHS